LRGGLRPDCLGKSQLRDMTSRSSWSRYLSNRLRFGADMLLSHRDSVDGACTAGFWDTVLMELVSASPELVGNWLLGLGPTSDAGNYSGVREVSI